jgi:hypothetical protein
MTQWASVLVRYRQVIAVNLARLFDGRFLFSANRAKCLYRSQRIKAMLITLLPYSAFGQRTLNHQIFRQRKAKTASPTKLTANV